MLGGVFSTDTILLIVIELFKFSISSCISIGKFHFPKIMFNSSTEFSKLFTWSFLQYLLKNYSNVCKICSNISFHSWYWLFVPWDCIVLSIFSKGQVLVLCFSLSHLRGHEIKETWVSGWEYEETQIIGVEDGLYWNFFNNLKNCFK